MACQCTNPGTDQEAGGAIVAPAIIPAIVAAPDMRITSDAARGDVISARIVDCVLGPLAMRGGMRRRIGQGGRCGDRKRRRRYRECQFLHSSLLLWVARYVDAHFLEKHHNLR